MERFKSMHFFHVTSPHTVGMHEGKKILYTMYHSTITPTSEYVHNLKFILKIHEQDNFCIILISTDDNTEN